MNARQKAKKYKEANGNATNKFTPQGILLLAKSDDTMLDVARNVIRAVGTTIEVPTGLRSLTVNRDQEIKDRIQELIGYLKNYVEWR